MWPLRISSRTSQVLVMLARPLLSSDLDDAFCSFGDGLHPFALTNEKSQRLFDVDILSRGTGQHGHQSVPVIGRRDHDRIDRLVVEQFAEIAMHVVALPPLA